MPKLIKLYHPCEVKEINSLKKYLAFTRNCFKILCKSGVDIKEDGILIPVRWSKEKSCWVVDRGTTLQRDIVGVDLNNIEIYYDKDSEIYKAAVLILNAVNSSGEFNNIANKRGIIKNSSKFIAFEVVKEKCFVIGLYKRKNKNRDIVYTNTSEQSEVIDKSQSLRREISGVLQNISPVECLKIKNKTYVQIYNEFLDILKEKEFYNISEFNVLFKEDFVLEAVSSFKEFKQNIYETGKNKPHSAINIYLTEYLGEFIKKELEIEDLEGITFYDSYLKKDIKIIGSLILKKKNSFKTILKSKEKDYSGVYLIPKAF